MRFLPEGPSIPDELLEERDNGNVVFLCGAGVSYPAGMPDFLGLARWVVDELGTPRDAPSRGMLSMWEDDDVPTGARPSLDHIFNLLQQEYVPTEIDYLIAKRLKTKPRTNLTAHQTILRLSTDTDGKPQVVTTNFDLLFEKAANRNLKTHVAPAIPDLAGLQSFDGIVYLHGRIDHSIKRGLGRHELIVSSSDFGRAYLAEGWATRFIRELLERHIVVLLGYSASDPPVRYLLQGLHTRGNGHRARLFTFDSGTKEEVQQHWRDTGVQAMAYPSTGSDHSVLWDTLSDWAERAVDPLAWREQVVELARRGPRKLTSHERGQVASLVRSDVGAKLFADAGPPPPAEWLCVFDHNVRYGGVGHDLNGVEPDFDPLVEYGLDDDPPRPPDPTRMKPPGDDLLSVRFAGPSTDSVPLVADIRAGATVPLPSRLTRLARWGAKVVSEPVTSWWAARYSTLHPNLLDRIEQHLEQVREELPVLALSTWRLLIEKSRTRLEDDPQHAWYKWRQRLSAEGWTNSVLRAFECVDQPYLTTRLPIGLNRAQPPTEDWSELCRSDIVEFDVAFPGAPRDRPKIPDDMLPAVYQVLRRNLGLAAGLFADIGMGYRRTATFYPEDKPGNTYLDGPSAFLFWFRGLFDKMAKANPDQVRADVALWPIDEPVFFDKLRLYAWAFEGLFSGKDVGEQLLALDDRPFWGTQHRRELLHLLRLRWHQLPPAKRRLLEQRLFDGPPKNAGESGDRYQRRRSIEAATNLGWLDMNGCQLRKATLNSLPRLRSADPRWSPLWDMAADASLDGRGGTVRTESDPAPILDAPLNQIIPLAQKHTRRDLPELTNHQPFDGLLKQDPGRAVAALAYEARQGNYAVEFWHSALHAWPDDAQDRLVWLFAETLSGLPLDVVAQLQNELFLWLGKCFQNMAAKDRTRALRVFDSFLEMVLQCRIETTASKPRVVGRVEGQPRQTFVHIADIPVDQAITMLFSLLNHKRAKGKKGIPSDVKSRLEHLVSTLGKDAHQAIHAIARQLRRLDRIDPEWTRATVVQWFNLAHPASDAAWNGFLTSSWMMEPESLDRELFPMLKPYFLEAFTHTSKPRLNEHAFLQLHALLVLACFQHQNDESYISYDEARDALQRTNDKGRAHSISYLNRGLLNGNRTRWRRFGKPFLKKAWPQEDDCRTEETAREFAELAEEMGDCFPEVVDTILPYLVQISKGGLFAYPLTEEGDEGGIALAMRFPNATLALVDKLVPDNPTQVPYKLDIVLEMIGQAKPQLRRDRRWQRLNDIILQR